MTRTEQRANAVAAPDLRTTERIAAAFARLPAWAGVLLVWTFGRALSTAWLGIALPLATRLQPANAIWQPWHGLMRFLTAWDGQYYEYISVHGYPSHLPVDATGHVAQNPWAFLPAFPLAIRALTITTGMPFSVGAPIVSALAGLIATFLLFAITRRHAGDRNAFFAVFLFAAGPLSFLLQVGYAESTFLALMFGAMLALERRRYALLTLLTAAAAFTRPGALAVPLALAVVSIVRLVAAVRADGVSPRAAFPYRERVAVVASGIVSAAAGCAWPLIATHATGVHDAYLKT